jgi:hypothetical protein
VCEIRIASSITCLLTPAKRLAVHFQEPTVQVNDPVHWDTEAGILA